MKLLILLALISCGDNNKQRPTKVNPIVPITNIPMPRPAVEHYNCIRTTTAFSVNYNCEGINVKRDCDANMSRYYNVSLWTDFCTNFGAY